MSGPRWRWLVHVVGAAAALLVQVLLWAGYYGFSEKRLVGDEVRYARTAMAIWHGNAPAADFIWPPLQAWFLAPLIGPLGGSLWFAQLVQILLLAASALLLRQIWLHLDPRPLAADISAWLFLSSPAIMAFGFFLWPEPLHLCLLLAALWLLLREPGSWFFAALAGAAIGLALLSKSLLSGFWPLLLLLCIRRPWKDSHWMSAMAFVLAVLVVTGPGLLQGWRATGKPLIADSAPYNMYVGLNDTWRSDYINDQGGQYMRQYLRAGATPRERNRAFNALISDELHAKDLPTVIAERLGVQYFRLFNAKRTLLSQLPGAPCAGYQSAYTLPAHWVMTINVITRLHYIILLLAAAFGLAMWRRNSMLAWLIALFFGYQLTLFLGLHVKARFLLPMMPFLAGFAGSAIRQSLPEQGQDAVSPLSFSRTRMLLALLLCVLCLLLAFAGPWIDQSCAQGQ